MNKTITLLSLAILTFLITDCFSQTTEYKDTSEKIDTAGVSFKPNILPGLNVPKLNAGNMNIDGVLNEDVWSNAVMAENFPVIT